MRNKNYRQLKLKKQLREKKNNGVRVLIWKLTPETKELVESFGYYVEPYIYQITTKSFSNIRLEKNRLLKDLHYMNKRGKRFECRPLNKEEKEILDKAGIKYIAVKFKIYLNQ